MAEGHNTGKCYRLCTQCKYAIPNNLSIFCGNCGYQFADRRNLNDTQMILGSLDRVRDAIGDINNRQTQFVHGLNGIGEIVREMGARVTRLEIIAERKKSLHLTSHYTNPLHRSIENIEITKSVTSEISDDSSLPPPTPTVKSASVPPPPVKPKPVATQSFEIDERINKNSDESDSEIEDISEDDPVEDIDTTFCDTPTENIYRNDFGE
ncbi:unnamed protein product [Bursaphelenchus xylophilus]|uniref:(pine wood nematode) hypothetical protein n=1 Tax=Bursaphelenchus xylophilus TaxID=6326 RepID=A0A1I7RZX2_BURXY|nr:unnamed protein product [Bursaphelenchus xylophilus]CAG9109169.1 unnamed protein product [Bursaphelenchus xylophilus]